MSELGRLLGKWPVVRQLRDGDRLGLGRAVRSEHTDHIHPRTEDADRVVQSVCPYCAVGCGQKVFVKDGKVTQVEGDPDSPISRGRLCPKGSATKSLVTGPSRETKVKYRPPHATAWEDLPLDRAMDMIADRVIATRRATWQDTDDQGRPVHRTMGIGSLGGATLDNEENYLIKKLATALGAVQIENQARI
ncbi:MAG: formate dehydrogenase major subunit [Actinomycetota bacterium]|nr:formate dehydrogenase major subunit [Actinomycetota bacterium]